MRLRETLRMPLAVRFPKRVLATLRHHSLPSSAPYALKKIPTPRHFTRANRIKPQQPPRHNAKRNLSIRGHLRLHATRPRLAPRPRPTLARHRAPGRLSATTPCSHGPAPGPRDRLEAASLHSSASADTECVASSLATPLHHPPDRALLARAMLKNLSTCTMLHPHPPSKTLFPHF